MPPMTVTIPMPTIVIQIPPQIASGTPIVGHGINNGIIPICMVCANTRSFQGSGYCEESGSSASKDIKEEPFVPQEANVKTPPLESNYNDYSPTSPPPEEKGIEEEPIFYSKTTWSGDYYQNLCQRFTDDGKFSSVDTVISFLKQ